MTNPDNIVRVRARNGGRASVYEANAWCQNWTTGFVEGSITQNTSADMNILVNGSPSKPAVAIAATPAPYNIALDIVGQKAIAITAPATNSRYSAIVAYTDDLSLATTEDTVTGSPASCGLIVVNGTTSATPVYPTDATIRTAITADGGTGSQAAYVVLAYVLVANDTTTITNSLITNTEAVLRNNAVATNSIKDSAVTAGKIDFTTLPGNYSTSEIDTGYTWIDGKKIYKKTIGFGNLPASTTKSVAHNISNIGTIFNVESVMVGAAGYCWAIPYTSVRSVSVEGANLIISTNSDLSSFSAYVTLYYTKTS